MNIIIGVVGASYSSVTIPLSHATFAMKLPLVSYAATNPELSHHKVKQNILYYLICSLFIFVFSYLFYFYLKNLKKDVCPHCVVR